MQFSFEHIKTVLCVLVIPLMLWGIKLEVNNAVTNETIEKLEEEVKKAPEDTVLIASALMAVTRNLYVSALGVEGTAHMFEAVADSFVETEEFIQQFKPTIH